MFARPKLFAVLETMEDCDDSSTTLFVKVFTKKTAAIQAIETAARETWEELVDPNDGDDRPFPGVSMPADNPNEYFMALSDACQLSWEIIEVKVAT